MLLHKICANHTKLSQSTNEGYNFNSAFERRLQIRLGYLTRDCFVFKVKINTDLYIKKQYCKTISIFSTPWDCWMKLLHWLTYLYDVRNMLRLWLFYIGWNDTLPEAMHREWHQFFINFCCINNININRCILMEHYTAIELHGFSDASGSGFDPMVYGKSNSSTRKTVVRLITCKSRVAPRVVFES